jgi:8-oxo-dGTP pyrophosphatase MutT (NUDIX family)
MPIPTHLPRSRRVISAGGVVLRESSKGLEVLCITLKQGRVRSLPKGRVEAKERYAETALREVREETGIEAEVLAPLGKIRYYFTVHEPEGPSPVTKEVHYFLMRYRSGHPKPQLTEVEAVGWLPAQEALERLSYKNERVMLHKALEIFAHLKATSPSPGEEALP